MSIQDLVVDYLIRGTLVLAITCLAIWVAGKLSISAAIRHRMGMIGTIVILLMPIFILLGWQWSIIPSPVSSENEIQYATGFSKMAIEPILKASPLPTPSELRSEKSGFSISQSLLILWSSGVICLMVFATSALILLNQVKRKTARVSPRIITILTQLLDSQRSKRDVSLAVSPNVNLPFTWGIFRPVIALPINVEEWPEERLRLVLEHELAHISRHDAVSLLLGRVLVALHWFNPLAWILNQRLESLREEACDALVLRKGAPPADYAELLFHMATGPRSIAVFTAAVSEPQTLQTRIKMILNNTTKLTRPTKGIFTIMSIIAITAMTLPFATLTFAQNDAKAALQDRKLEDIIIPTIEFSNTPLPQAMEFLVQRSKELDTISKDPKEKGINIACIGAFDDILVTLKLKSIPLGEAVKLTAMIANGEMEKTSNAVVIRQQGKAESVIEISENAKGSATNQKLNKITIPSIQLSKTKVTEALAFVQQRSVELDTKSPADTKGINIVYKPTKSDTIPTVTLRLQNTTLHETLSLIAESAGLKMQINGNYVLMKESAPK